MIPEVNFLALIVAPLVTGVMAIVAIRYGKSYEAGVQAQAAILNIPTKIIDQLQERISRMTEEIDKLWARDRECRGELDEANHRIKVLEQRIGVV